jgi:molybdopterin converting factor small subunit
MEKISLKLFEFYNLDAELNGLTNQQTGEKVASGLIQEKLSLVTKYWLTELGKKVAAEKASVEELKNDLIKKYGKEDEKGGISIPMVIEELDSEGQPVKDIDKDGNWFTKKVINPAYQDFEREFNELLQTEKELEYKAFTLDDFEKVETSENYGTFFKLIKIEETKVVPLN